MTLSFGMRVAAADRSQQAWKRVKHLVRRRRLAMSSAATIPVPAAVSGGTPSGRSQQTWQGIQHRAWDDAVQLVQSWKLLLATGVMAVVGTVIVGLAWIRGPAWIPGGRLLGRPRLLPVAWRRELLGVLLGVLLCGLRRVLMGGSPGMLGTGVVRELRRGMARLGVHLFGRRR
jgi:hypothetical protein